MKFLADMGISQSTVNWLRDRGFDGIHLREEKLHRISDAAVIEKAKKEGRIISVEETRHRIRLLPI